MIIGGYITRHYGCKDNVEPNYNHEISIATLKENYSQYTDSLITLQGIMVEETENILNYTKATITDSTGETLQFITNQPCEKGKPVDITGRLHFLPKKDADPNLIFVDEHLRPVNDFLRLLSDL